MVATTEPTRPSGEPPFWTPGTHIQWRYRRDADGGCRRKDEDELAEAVLQARFTPDEAEQIEDDATQVERILDAWGSPFCDGWETFRPDPSWTFPQPALA